ncbi:hypothetical protein [Novisyntrophococcus fermenticellae]|uniref:hypothetical protein n=1 Tax=Novisyntrophococcus fermenticellae TaxID=2068655 RepID=UPI001E5FFFD6|nr:hypothetical protein [Novisyntrophococcus fermenticellae]
MKQIILYLKATVLSGAAALLLMVSLLYAGVEVLDVFFWMLLTYFGLYFGVLAVIEEKSPESGNSQSNNK